jgi:hypothetical protein
MAAAALSGGKLRYGESDEHQAMKWSGMKIIM